MNDQQRHVDAEVAAYALNALDTAERAQVESHLADCEPCRALLADYQELVELLPLGLPLAAPPAGAKARLLARVGASTEGDKVEPVPPSFERRMPRRIRWQALAAAAVLVLMLGWNVRLQRQVAALQAGVDVAALAQLPTERVIPLVGTGQPGAVARLYLDESGAEGVLAISGLPTLPEDRVYQLWFAQPENPTRTGGAFRVNARNEALVEVTIPYPLEVVSAIAVTEEAAPRVESPTTPHLLDGAP